MESILIVEDEVLIAWIIKRYLEKNGCQVAGLAISYEEAVAILEDKANSIDLALLDIRLNDKKTGIDVGRYIQKHVPALPIIYLTSQVDSKHINAAKESYPASYLSKPIQKESLLATIAVNLHRNRGEEKLVLQLGTQKVAQPVEKILYLEADHIYVKVVTENKSEPLLVRQSLKDLLGLLPTS